MQQKFALYSQIVIIHYQVCQGLFPEKRDKHLKDSAVVLWPDPPVALPNRLLWQCLNPVKKVGEGEKRLTRF